MSKFLLIGHRGAAGLAPENTLASIKKALELKVDRIEIDLQQTKDQVLIAMHDRSLNRTTSGKGIIKNHTYSSIAKFCINTNFPDLPTEPIPRLEEILDLIDGKATLLIDLKYGNSYYPKIEEQIINILNNQNATDWSVIHSFSNEVLQTFHHLDHQLTLGKLLVGKIPYLPFFIDHRLKYGIPVIEDFIKEVNIFYPFINKRLIDKMHREHKKVFAWTVNQPKTAQQLMDMGIDGIVTDYPNRYTGILDKYS